MKRVLKWIGRLIAVIIALFIIAGVVVFIIVDREFVESRMRSALNRHVTIEDINVGIFSVVSGIEVKNVMISNYKTEKQLKALEGKPVSPNDLFAGLKGFKFKVKFLPLLEKRFVLNELMLYEPKINVIRSKKGYFNFNDLIAPGKMTPEEKAELTKELEEEAREKAEEAKKGKREPEKPLTADDIPVRINIGKVGMEKGLITVIDKKFNQSFQVYNLTATAYSIKIDPGALDKENSVKVDVGMGIKTTGKVKSGSVKSFDIGFSVKGGVKPFDVKTRKLDPEVGVNAGSSYGSMTGLQIFENLKSIEQLEKYCGKLSFLKETIKWKDAYVKVWYKGGTVKLTDGRIKTDDFRAAFSGSTNINTKALMLDLDMILADKHKAKIRSGINKNVKKVLKGKLGKYVKPDKVTDTGMKPMLNKKGEIYLKYRVTGRTDNPKTKLVHPELPSMKDLTKNAAGKIGDIVKDRAKEEAKKAADKAKKKAKSKAKKKAKKKLKKFKI